MSLAGRIHLPGTSVTGLPEMINLSLPATSDQECRLPGAGGNILSTSPQTARDSQDLAHSAPSPTPGASAWAPGLPRQRAPVILGQF